jgi:hypothetical protein
MRPVFLRVLRDLFALVAVKSFLTAKVAKNCREEYEEKRL